MKKAQQAVKVSSVMIKENQTKKFLKDLFAFKNITVIKPILHKVDYKLIQNPNSGKPILSFNVAFGVSILTVITIFKEE